VRYIRRILTFATMLMVVSVSMLAPSAEAGPPPPAACWHFMFNDGSDGALGGCRSGYGTVRVIARCANDNGARVSYAGPWVPVGSASRRYCSSTYPYVVGSAIQTQIA
jgi:hypothetical protein